MYECSNFEKDVLWGIDVKIEETYHDPKKNEFLHVYIFFSVLCLLFKPRIFFEVLIWGLYISNCRERDKKWSNHPDNVKKRKLLLELKEKIESGKWDGHTPPEIGEIPLN